MTTPAKGHKKIEGWVTEEAAEMFAAMKKTSGARTSGLLERLIRMQFHSDPLHLMASAARREISLPAHLASPVSPPRRSRPRPRRSVLG